ncbi:MAG: hypothetical protein JXN61_10505 [Sedimentisphaerales bacterium]|nr:hypothetical protein [Sedimentisphaerales bacterium]
MSKLTLRAKSSEGEPYNVDFIVDNGRLSVYCNCKAGIFGQLCKHKTELIGGDESRLFDLSENDKMAQVTAMMAKVPEVQSLAARIAQSEKLIRREQAKIKTLKKQFGALLHEGIPIVENTQ